MSEPEMPSHFVSTNVLLSRRGARARKRVYRYLKGSILGVISVLLFGGQSAFPAEKASAFFIPRPEFYERLTPLVNAEPVERKTSPNLFRQIGIDFKFEDMNPYQVMLVAAVLLAASLSVTFVVNRQRCTVCPINRSVEKKPISGKGGFQLVFSDRYLLLIAGLTLLLNLVNTTGEFILGEFVVREASQLPLGERSQFVGAFYGNYFWWVNVIGVGLQILITPRLLKRFGAQGALFVLPVIALGGYSMLVTVPTIALIKLVKIFENATDYSIQNTARQALFLVTSRDAKYKAKTAIDTFFVRLGDMAQAGLVAGGLALGFGPGGFALVNLGFVAVWIVLVVMIFFEYRRRMAARVAAETSTA